MRIGLWIQDEARTIEEIAIDARAAEDSGVSRIWCSQRTGWDALTLIAALGPHASRIQYAVGVVPVYPRHPLALAAQALSVQAATGNRLTLGIGSSHPVIVEGQYGLSMKQPAKYMREYVETLAPLVRGEPVDHHGDLLTAAGQVSVAGAVPPELILAALGPRMLAIAGELADGTVTSWAGPEVIGDYVRPTIDKAAGSRPSAQVIACVCVAVTDDPDGARGWIKEHYGVAGSLPAYRAILDRGAANGPEDTAVVGDEDEVARQLRRFAEAGTTEFMVAPVGTAQERARTIAFTHAVAAG
ncbi:TIGR03564 family F420-dependent LLM class oxidoreductase [Kribbella italica]|uniref:F420-dependent oxidoreductase-like protein n=1 Tax=Kribbella italica TaxID=1540520 RepID=A0A7W9J553_9ACTN|nr:TIGR03564 family F420-dependent LLM class oxidoreductase [Kribbella italica]MBB5835565.1 F420-dependent oxidoreductase-like protein [Kribbella italica]